MSKRIVVCSDGTWNQPNQDRPTNVVKVARAIRESDSSGAKQITFYDPGVGSRGSWISKLLGGAAGHGIEQNIRDTYKFLVDTYEPGDELFLFGFSRGAYTVRSLVGMIRNVGILTGPNADKLDAAWALYRRRDKNSHPDAAGPEQFKEEFSHTPDIKFLGVWDTVGALGIPIGILHSLTAWKHRFHNVRLSGIVQNAYQALAIDEKRKPFKPSIWTGTPKPGQKVEQVWFPGVHSDIGGGNANDSLADVAFGWLTAKAVECGLALDEGYLKSRVDPYPRGPRHYSMTWWYKVLRSRNRPMGSDASAATEWVHGTVLDRTQDPIFNYTSDMLRKFLQQYPNRVTR